MKIIALVLILAASANAALVGKFDIGGDPSALGMRDLENGVWRIGAEYPGWHLQNTTRNREVFHVNAFYATRLEGQNAIYGPAVGVNVGQALALTIGNIEFLATAAEKAGLKYPPFLDKLGDWTTFDIFAGYGGRAGGGDKRWGYGIGGEVLIPVNMLYQWAAGTQAQGTGVKGL